ncbi:hypothetical protein BN77_p2150072 [Rhizobium mesoamericanum STM3625]|uniref:Uncharacterized protein n=1 Tax=Rhizobium mesoamericanum STM3625 TaxID=1211777 RepID=K0PTH0_9HYPH|nr:hypothetical protein BN77_p2150072 [Rhizobium mesoamericanum STM3625]
MLAVIGFASRGSVFKMFSNLLNDEQGMLAYLWQAHQLEEAFRVLQLLFPEIGIAGPRNALRSSLAPSKCLAAPARPAGALPPLPRRSGNSLTIGPGGTRDQGTDPQFHRRSDRRRIVTEFPLRRH